MRFVFSTLAATFTLAALTVTVPAAAAKPMMHMMMMMKSHTLVCRGVYMYSKDGKCVSSQS